MTKHKVMLWKEYPRGGGGGGGGREKEEHKNVEHYAYCTQLDGMLIDRTNTHVNDL